MPTYEYKCQKCEKKFENFESITATPLNKCPDCGGMVKRLIGTGLTPIFKGSGFYQTDYKNSSNKSKGDKVESKSDTEKPVSKPKETAAKK